MPLRLDKKTRDSLHILHLHMFHRIVFSFSVVPLDLALLLNLQKVSVYHCHSIFIFNSQQTHKQLS